MPLSSRIISRFPFLLCEWNFEHYTRLIFWLHISSLYFGYKFYYKTKLVPRKRFIVSVVVAFSHKIHVSFGDGFCYFCQRQAGMICHDKHVLIYIVFYFSIRRAWKAEVRRLEKSLSFTFQPLWTCSSTQDSTWGERSDTKLHYDMSYMSHNTGVTITGHCELAFGVYFEWEKGCSPTCEKIRWHIRILDLNTRETLVLGTIWIHSTRTYS